MEYKSLYTDFHSVSVNIKIMSSFPSLIPLQRKQKMPLRFYVAIVT